MHLKTIGVWGTKQVMGRQLTRPFLVRDAPHPHPVFSAPSTPPPRGTRAVPTHIARVAHSRAARAPSDTASREKENRWVVHGRESHVKYLGSSNPPEKAAIRLLHPLSYVHVAFNVRREGRFSARAARPAVRRSALGDVALEDEGGVWP